MRQLLVEIVVLGQNNITQEAFSFKMGGGCWLVRCIVRGIVSVPREWMHEIIMEVEAHYREVRLYFTCRLNLTPFVASALLHSIKSV